MFQPRPITSGQVSGFPSKMDLEIQRTRSKALSSFRNVRLPHVFQVCDAKGFSKALVDLYWKYMAGPEDSYSFRSLRKCPYFRVDCKNTIGTEIDFRLSEDLEQKVNDCEFIRPPAPMLWNGGKYVDDCEDAENWPSSFRRCAYDLRRAFGLPHPNDEIEKHESLIQLYGGRSFGRGIISADILLTHSPHNWTMLMDDMTHFYDERMFKKNDFLLRSEIIVICATLFAQMNETFDEDVNEEEEDPEELELDRSVEDGVRTTSRYVYDGSPLTVTTVNVIHNHVRVVQATCNPSRGKDVCLSFNVRAYYRLSIIKEFDSDEQVKQAATDVVKWLVSTPCSPDEEEHLGQEPLQESPATKEPSEEERPTERRPEESSAARKRRLSPDSDSQRRARKRPSSADLTNPDIARRN
ncbi:hypothetical protein KEM55_002505 [Ascosphaera atra]|nr:hypothetical protein KEM55_002505 [Ascosphaera atra]